MATNEKPLAPFSSRHKKECHRATKKSSELVPSAARNTASKKLAGLFPALGPALGLWALSPSAPPQMLSDLAASSPNPDIVTGVRAGAAMVGAGVENRSEASGGWDLGGGV